MALIDAIDAHLAWDQEVRGAARNPRAVERAGSGRGRALGPQPGERTSRRLRSTQPLEFPERTVQVKLA